MNELYEHKEAKRLGVVWPFPVNEKSHNGPCAKALRPVTSRQAKQHQKEALWQMPEALF
jgi:hypothetical protein